MEWMVGRLAFVVRALTLGRKRRGQAEGEQMEREEAQVNESLEGIRL